MTDLSDRRTILVVDDDPQLLTLMGRHLDARGWLALLAQRPDEALHILDHYPDELDLLITDIVLPETNGFTLASQVVDRRPDLRILYISGYFDDSRQVRYGLREAGRFFLRKPFRQDDFLRMVATAINQSVTPTDAFALILGHPLITALAIRDWPHKKGASPRDLRYQLQLPIRYRLSSMTRWTEGRTHDVRTGLSFETSTPLRAACGSTDPAEIDIRLVLPTAGEHSTEIVCHGRVARVVPLPESDGQSIIGVAVEYYHADIRH